MTVKLTNITPGNATVVLDGEVVGEVHEKVTRYNLRRVFVARGWYARAKNGGQRFPAGDSTYGKRADAVAALAAYAEATGCHCMTEPDPITGEEKVLTHSGSCPFHPEYEPEPPESKEHTC